MLKIEKWLDLAICALVEMENGPKKRSTRSQRKAKLREKFQKAEAKGVMLPGMV